VYRAVLILIVLIYSGSFARNKILEVGEELNYKVYYGFIKLGDVKVKLSSRVTEKKEVYYTSIAYLKSYDGIPFVYVNFYFESTMTNIKDSIFSKFFSSTEFKQKSGGESNYSLVESDYYFYYPLQYRVLQKTINASIVQNDTTWYELMPKFQDGLSIFYNARLHSLSPKLYKVPVFISDQESSVNYSFNMNEDVVSVNAVEYDVSVIKIEGTALFKAVFGLTGDFTGWLSNDEYRVPVKAKFNVTIGSITLELDSYKKSTWIPPRYKGS
jgi:hypothetical protein